MRHFASFLFAVGLVACGGGAESHETRRAPSTPQMTAQDEAAYAVFRRDFEASGDRWAPEDRAAYEAEGAETGGEGFQLAGWCATYPNVCFVNYAYHVLLGRTSLTDPYSHGWVAALRHRTMTHAQVWWAIRVSPEGCARLGC